MACELQIWISVLVALILVMLIQLATTLKGVTPALVTLDTQEMDFLAQVCKCIYFDIISDIAKGGPAWPACLGCQYTHPKFTLIAQYVCKTANVAMQRF